MGCNSILPQPLKIATNHWADLNACQLLTTTTSNWEPAWHRRDRRHRSNARTLVRVANAANILQSHHSAQKMNKWEKEKDWLTVFGKGTNKVNWEKDLIPGITAAIAASIKEAGLAASQGSAAGGPKGQNQQKGKGKGQGKGKGKGKGPQETLPTASRNKWVCPTCYWGNRYLDAEKCYNRNCQAPNPHYKKAHAAAPAAPVEEKTAEQTAKEKRDKRLKRVLGPFDPTKLESQRTDTPQVAPMDVDTQPQPAEKDQAARKAAKKDLEAKLKSFKTPVSSRTKAIVSPASTSDSR